MPIIAKQDNANFEQPTPGTVQAVCVFVHDIGNQPGEYQGKPRIAHKIIVAWELGQKMTTGEFAGKPFMITKYYTLSLSEKASLRKDLEAWRGKAFTEAELKGFDVESIKGANCLLSIVETENGKRKVNGVMALPAGMTKLAPTLTEPSERYMEWIERERAKAVPDAPTVEPGAAPVVTSEDGGEGDLPF